MPCHLAKNFKKHLVIFCILFKYEYRSILLLRNKKLTIPSNRFFRTIYKRCLWLIRVHYSPIIWHLQHKKSLGSVVTLQSVIGWKVTKVITLCITVHVNSINYLYVLSNLYLGCISQSYNHIQCTCKILLKGCESL